MADNEVLSVKFEADIAALAKAVAEAERRIEKFEKGAEKSSKRTSEHFGAMNNSMAKLGLGVSLAGIVAGVEKLASDAKKLSNVAEVAGLTAQRFQELAFAAREVGMSQDEFAQAMLRFSTGVAEAKTRTGQLYEFLKYANPALLQQVTSARSTSEAFDAMAEAVRRMDTAENQALLTKKAFGENTFMLTKALKGGVPALEEAAKAAKNYGQVVNDEALKATKELGLELDRAWSWIKTNATNMLGGAAKQIREAFESGLWTPGGRRDAGGKLFDPFTAEAATAASSIKGATDALAGWNAEVKGTLAQKPDFRGVDELAALTQSLAAARGRANEQIGLDAQQAFERVKRLHAEGTLSEGEYQRARVLITQRAEAQRTDLTRQTEGTLNDLRRNALEANGNFYDAIRMEYEKDLADYQLMLDRKLISTAQFEEARNNLNAVAGDRIRQRMKEDGENIRSQMADFENAIEGPISGALNEAFRGGKVNAREFFVDLLAGINNAIVRMLVLKPLMDGLFGGTSGTGGIVGNLMGLTPQRAEGGAVMAGVPYQVNERRGRLPEVFVPSVAGRVVPGERARGGGGGGGPVTNNYIDARYSDIGVEERIMARLAQAEALRPRPTEVVRADRNRFPTRR